MGIANNDAAIQGIEIEGMQRLAQLEHDVICNVDHRINRTNTGTSQSLDNVGRRTLGEIYIFYYATQIAWTLVGRLYLHRELSIAGHISRVFRRLTQRNAVECRKIPRYTDHSQTVCPIGCQTEFKRGVI